MFPKSKRNYHTFTLVNLLYNYFKWNFRIWFDEISFVAEIVIWFYSTYSILFWLYSWGSNHDCWRKEIRHSCRKLGKKLIWLIWILKMDTAPGTFVIGRVIYGKGLLNEFTERNFFSSILVSMVTTEACQETTTTLSEKSQNLLLQGNSPQEFRSICCT